ncbi:MAG TPA: transcriptional repressor [Lentisphaeria bacterium]|jgi:Fur family ferric uptake transcriptional regulator|nr:transcriptional repressor [Lentisphaeria bacterium]
MQRRNTQQREAIRTIFQDCDRPLSVAEVLSRGQEDVPSLNQATVYRTLNLLVDEGWLVRIQDADAGTMFERAGLDHHHHFYCRSCEHMYDLPGCPLEAHHGVPGGFTVESHEVVFRGVCETCSDGVEA